VREVLPAPAAADAVLAAVQRQARKRPAAAATPESRGEVLAFVSCKGGSGATFTAANLAYVLAAGGQRRVALIDMNLQFGDALLFVSSDQPGSNVADLARNIQRLDSDLLLSAMVSVAPGLHVLAAPEDPAQASDVLPEHVRAIVELAKSMFDIVVIDTGRSLSTVSLQALDLADQVYAVLQLTLPFIRDGKRLRDIFRSLDYPEKKIHWVVNRYEKNGQITLDDLKKTLGITEIITLPNQYEVVAASVNQGVPVAKVAPNSAVARALRDWALRIAPPVDKPRPGWLYGLFRGTPASVAHP
jgi:pilus assembly protein CpaE